MPRGNRKPVVRHRALLEQWARCDGTMAEACRWVLAKLDGLEQEKRNLAREIAAVKEKLNAVESDVRVGKYLEEVRSLEKRSGALVDEARAGSSAYEQESLFEDKGSS